MMTFAKGLGNGFAVGGVVARGDLMDALPAVGLATFGGNPISMAAANATLDYVLDHDLQANAARTGAIIMDGLREAAARLPIVKDVRGKGLMFAVELQSPDQAARFMEEFYTAYRASGRAADALRTAQLRTRGSAASAVWSSFVVRSNELP